MTVRIIPVFCNEKNMANYAYILTTPNTTIIIDAAEATPIINELEKQNLAPTHILTTHHHYDHVGGNVALKQKYNLKIVAPAKEFSKVPAADIKAEESIPLTIGDLTFDVIAAPGHTLGHVLYYLKSENMLFTGDVLFNLCVGGLFEGTIDQMAKSLEKIKALPDTTLIFPGHEYTRAALTPNLISNPNFAPYLEKMLKREKGELAPTTLGEEKQFNPYLTSDNLKGL